MKMFIYFSIHLSNKDIITEYEFKKN